MRLSFYKVLIAAGSVLFLGAYEFSCSSGNGELLFESSAQASDESPAGAFAGAFTSTIGNSPVSDDVVAVISVDDEIQVVFPIDEETHVAGTVRVSGSQLNADLVRYDGAFGRFVGLRGVNDVFVDATVVERGSIAGDFDATDDQGVFALDFLTTSDVDSSLELTAGVWTFDMAASGGGTYTVTWDIDESGLIFGADTNGCVFNGRISLIDSRFNAYRVVVDVTACDRFNAEYRGLAFLESTGGPELDRLTVGVSNNAYAFATVLQR